MGVANNKCHGKVIWGGVDEGTENCISSNVDRLPATTKKSVKVGGFEVDLKVGGGYISTTIAVLLQEKAGNR